MVKKGAKGGHFCQLKAMEKGESREKLYAGWKEGAKRMPVPAGGLLLWSSRTVHQGWSGGPRLAQPVCWEPSERVQPTAHLRKLRMAATGLPSTHWASLGQPHYLVAPTQADPVEACMSDDGLVLPLKP